ncbi:MAG: DUF5034 domain-containing protein [Cytophagaceae bacterium]|jgi:hypothetical protein|nr:DUF5034 domain-containing protein [Cytophagaceae bacterium]
MNKLFKIYGILFILLAAGIVAEGCWPHKCDYTEYNFNFTSLRVRQAESLGIGNWPVSVEPRPVLRENYGIHMFFDGEREIREIHQALNSNRRNLLLIQSAYAFSPASCENYTLKSTITAIQIVSENDFDSLHPAGSDITEYFGVQTNMNEDGTPVFKPVADYLKDMFEYLSKTDIEYTPVFDMHCMLTTPPEAGEYTFTVVACMSDGRTLKQSIKAELR